MPGTGKIENFTDIIYQSLKRIAVESEIPYGVKNKKGKNEYF